MIGLAVLASGMLFFSQPSDGYHTSTATDPRPLSVQLVRIVGYAIGTDIQGYFQLVVTGPTNLTHVTIHFNSTLTYNTTQPQFTWPFHTDDYPLGWTNITVHGSDANATRYEWHLLKRFVPSDVNTPYWIAALLFIILFPIIIIVAKVHQLRNKPLS